ncbi:MAG TPA: VWA domain-containing protein [Blastocatellia bacterium]|nr:VWA domain-containing protein [Blastocatellia bacterium]
MSKYPASSRVALFSLAVAALLVLPLIQPYTAAAQSGRKPAEKKAEKKTDVQKGAPPGQQGGEQEPPVAKNTPTIKLSTQVVGVDVTVIDKKSHRLITNLNKSNFTIYEDGVKQDITNFSPGDGPVTVVLLLDNGYQNHYFVNYYDPSMAQEIFTSAAGFVQIFMKPGDYAGLVTFAMKPKVIQDFTDDRQVLLGALQSAYNDLLNFHESNIYDALNFVLLGGKAVQLYDEKAGASQYLGLDELEGRSAVLLITTGIDTFSRITYDKAMKIVEGAGVPIFTIGVGNLFFKKYESRMSEDLRSSFLQADNALNTFAKLSGGAYFPMTFEGEIPSIMKTIAALLRSQYSLGYVPSNTRAEGKERKIKVSVDVNGDGQPDDAKLDLRYREKYVEPGGNPKKK